MSDELSDQEIMEAVRQHEAQEVQHVKKLLGHAHGLVLELKEIEQQQRSQPVEPSMHEKTRMVRDHAISRYYDRWLRQAAALPPVNLADMDQRAGPDDMQAFAEWFKRKAQS
jgi:hypothetical protein